MPRPDVSVCIPAYRNPETLERALRSACSQRDVEFEIIVTDDSPDHSVEQVIRKFHFDAPVVYQHNSTRLGSPENWNYAVSLASADLVKILHHDDWLSSSDSLASYVALMWQHPEADLGFSATAVSGPDGSVQRIHRPPPWLMSILARNPLRLFPLNLIGSPSATIFRRAAAVAFDAKLQWVVDLDFYIRVLLKKRALAYSPQALVCTSNGLATQVTALSLGKAEVELFEWTYLYARLFDGSGAAPNLFQLKFMWDILDRHGVSSIDELSSWLRGGRIPPTIGRMIRVRAVLAQLRSVLRGVGGDVRR